MDIRKKTFCLRRFIKRHSGKCFILIVIIIIGTYLFYTVRASQFYQPYLLPEVHRIAPVPLPGRKYPEKKWLKRMNSLEAARYAQSQYIGMEIDIVFEEGQRFLDVRHPPTASIGLSLDVLIGEIKNPRHHFYWLDFKNLTDANKQTALDELYRIARKYDIVNNIIVESSNASVLTNFSDRGFYTSYCLPRIEANKMTAEELKSHVNNIFNQLDKNPVNYVSANQNQYPLIKKYLIGYDMLLWNSTDNPLAAEIIERKLLKDPHVKIILVEDKSVGYR